METNNVSRNEVNCTMDTYEREHFNVVATVRLVMACLSTLGAFSIVGSAAYTRTVCNPKVHPIFVLSIVDVLLSLLWISGSGLWLGGEAKEQDHSRVGCFALNLVTVILQCVAMNVTLIYALLAYSSIKQRDFSGVYMVEQRPASVHVWHPYCSFIAYLFAWALPVVLIMIPFGVLSSKYKLLHQANKFSCWCLPFYGNVLPRPQIGYHNGEEGNEYLHNLHFFITSYAVVLVMNFAVVFCCMAVIYYKVFRRIRRMILTQGDAENTLLIGATRAMILKGQKRARKRVLFFFSIYLITGIITFCFGLENIVVAKIEWSHHNFSTKRADQWRVYILLLLEAVFVPVQGFLNALAYGWTREDFLTTMSSRHSRSYRPQSNAAWPATSLGENEEQTEMEVDREDWLYTQNSILSSS